MPNPLGVENVPALQPTSPGTPVPDPLDQINQPRQAHSWAETVVPLPSLMEEINTLAQKYITDQAQLTQFMSKLSSVLSRHPGQAI